MDEREEYLVKRVKDLEAKLEKTEAGAEQIRMLVDAMLIQMTMEFGVKQPRGYRVNMPRFNAKALLEEYELAVEEKDDFEYVIRASRREA